MCPRNDPLEQIDEVVFYPGNEEALLTGGAAYQGGTGIDRHVVRRGNVDGVDGIR